MFQGVRSRIVGRRPWQILNDIYSHQIEKMYTLSPFAAHVHATYVRSGYVTVHISTAMSCGDGGLSGQCQDAELLPRLSLDEGKKTDKLSEVLFRCRCVSPSLSISNRWTSCRCTVEPRGRVN